MTTLKEMSVGRSDLFRLNLDDINVVEGFNVREHDAAYEEHIALLALSISEVGVLEPLRGYISDGKFYLTNGHSRLIAVRKANAELGASIETVPVLPEPKYSNEADRVLTLLTSNSGRPLSALEQAKVFKRLVDFGWSESDIARKSGVSVTTVIRALEMNALPEAAKQLIRDGKASASLTLETVKSGELDKLTEAAANSDKKVTRQKLDNVERAQRGHKTTAKSLIENWDVDTSDEDEVVIRVNADDWKKFVKLMGV